MHSDQLPGSRTIQSQREIAYSASAGQQFCSAFSSFGKVGNVAGRSRYRSAAFSLHRYPSPDRPAYSPSRPITEFRLSDAKNVDDIGYHYGIAIHQGAVRTHSGAAKITTIGIRSCTRKQSSLRQWPYLVCQVASEMTLNVAWSERVRALLPRKSLGRIAPGRCLPVQRSASFVTTRASRFANKVVSRAHAGRVMNENRRRGAAPAAVLSFFGDGK